MTIKILLTLLASAILLINIALCSTSSANVNNNGNAGSACDNSATLSQLTASYWIYEWQQYPNSGYHRLDLTMDGHYQYKKVLYWEDNGIKKENVRLSEIGTYKIENCQLFLNTLSFKNNDLEIFATCVEGNSEGRGLDMCRKEEKVGTWYRMDNASATLLTVDNLDQSNPSVQSITFRKGDKEPLIAGGCFNPALIGHWVMSDEGASGELVLRSDSDGYLYYSKYVSGTTEGSLVAESSGKTRCREGKFTFLPEYYYNWDKGHDDQCPPETQDLWSCQPQRGIDYRIEMVDGVEKLILTYHNEGNYDIPYIRKAEF